MRKYLWVFSLVTGMLGSGSVAIASHTDEVNVTPITVSGCGAQSVTITGTAQYSAPVQHLVVMLDSVQVLHNDDLDARNLNDQPVPWSTELLPMSTGAHTVTATIFNSAEGDGHEDLLAQDTETFTVPFCEQGGPPPAPAGPDSSDCCPGPDPVVPPAKKVGRVKGAATGTLPAKLFWMNETFEKVHGRIPTFKEWSYWANRLLTDKPEYPALYGAMQWHKLRGRTVGT